MDMRIVITGADGFMGQNLRVRLQELGYTGVQGLTRSATSDEFRAALAGADFVFHLAGVNRPRDPGDFARDNSLLTEDICAALGANGRRTSVVMASSSQAALDNPYGRSKLQTEQALQAYGNAADAQAHIFRLNNVFGKWCRPNYNSVVATFCHNIARELPIMVNDPAAELKLVHIDDVVLAFIRLLEVPGQLGGYAEAGPVYTSTVGDIADTLRGFAQTRHSLFAPRAGTGLVRALYSTYVSYLPHESFAYDVPVHGDARGEFVEMLKTPDCGQFSYFTAPPGITRGEHYHHTKTEKFLVIKGTARFAFRHIITGQTYELVTRGGQARIVETVPGYTHNICNIGHDEMVVMLWANEVFDRQRPDTVAMKVQL